MDGVTNSENRPQAGDKASACVFAVLLGVLVAWQGGYYPEASALVGAAAFAAALALLAVRVARRRRVRVPFTVPCAFGVAACLLAGGALHGSLENGFDLALLWLCAAAFALMAAEIRRTCVLDALAWLGVAAAVLGILMFAGLVPFPGSVVAGRLQFTFQYANAAGAWYAATCLLALASEGAALRRAACLPLLALLLTQSMGSILLETCAVAALCPVKTCAKEPVAALGVVAQAASALIGFAACLLAGSLAAPVAAVAALAASCGLSALVEGRLGDEDSAAYRILAVSAVLAVAAGLLCAGLLVATGRLGQAAATFAERLAQMRDAATLLSASPLLGIGPDGWAASYQAVQTADYKTSVVHCGYLQLALDGGVVAPLLLVGAIGVGFSRAARRRDLASALPVALLALHSLVDFDLRFAALAAVLLVLLDVPPVCDARDSASPWPTDAA